MKVRLASLAVAAAVAFGASLYAQPGAAEGMGHDMGHGAGMMGHSGCAAGPGGLMDGHSYGMIHNTDAVLASLKTSLKITGAEDGAWKAFSDAMHANAAAMHAAMSEMMVDGPPKTDADRQKLRQTMQTMHQQSVNAIKAAARALYKALDPAQKKAMDTKPSCGGGVSPH